MFAQNLMAQRQAIVTGASQGIGRACAETLAALSCQLTLVARNQEALESLIKELPAHPNGHKMICCDLSDPAAVRDMLSDFDTPIDILINNSGGPAPGPLSEAPFEQLQSAFNQHVVAPQMIAQACIPGMKERKFGRIVNIISTSVKAPLPGLGVSNTIRGATANWAKTLANELGPWGITVNNILPGFTATARLDDIIERKMAKENCDRETCETKMKSSVPLRRFGQPEELAQACAFLCSDMASYISGINLPVDGGRTVCL